MSKKKHKFDLTHLVHQGALDENQTLFFVSDPSKTCKIIKQPNGEFKVIDQTNEVITVHAFVQACLGQEPNDHATRWLRTENGKTLFELWQTPEDQAA